MAYRCLEKIKIDGQIVNLMQINNVANAVSAGSGWAVGISNSYIASQGDNFLDIFGVGWITDNIVYTKYVDGSNAVLTNYAQSQSGDLYNFVTFDVSNLTTTRAETGYLNPSSQYGADHIYWGIAIDDDIQEGVLFTGIAKGTGTGNLYMFNNDSNKRKDIYNAFKTPKQGGGAGSGYIGNSLLGNKKMVGFNVPTSSAEGTKTESVNEVSASAVSGKPKSGNGFAKIKFLRDLIETNLSSLAKNTDFVNHRKVSGQATDNISFQYTFADLTAYYLSDWILSGSPNTNTYQNGEFNIPIASAYGSGFLSNGVAIPIDGDTKIYGVKFDCKVVYTIDGSFPRQGFLELIKIGSGNTVTRIDLLRICRDPSMSYDPNNPSHRLAEDDLYHTYEFIFDSPVTFDYVHVNGSDVDVYIKNIKLLT